MFGGMPLGVPCRKRLMLQKRTIVSCGSFRGVGSRVRSISTGCGGPEGLYDNSIHRLGGRVATGEGMEFCTFALIHTRNISFRGSEGCRVR